jgi:putative transferase (TIGR04331 family)
MSRLFLATTALDNFWDKEADEILFLGTWCLRYDARDVWQKLPHRVLPSIWDDRKRFYEATAYLDALNEKLLPNIARYMNLIHDEKHSDRYWRILIGPWLLHALHVIYDRYVHLAEARALAEFDTLGLDPSDYLVPFTTYDHHVAIKSDVYNLQLFTQILELEGFEVPLRKATSNIGAAQFPQQSALRVKARSLINNIERGLERLIASKTKVALYEVYASRVAQIRLALESRLALLPMQPASVNVRRLPVFDTKRNGLNGVPASNEFEAVFGRLLPYLMPTLYIEGYRELLDSCAVPSVQAIASVGGWFFDEGLKCRAAVLADRGGKLFALQHGGGYGTYRYAPAELHERRIADKFLAWGWAGNDPGLSDAAGARLSEIAARQITARDISKSRSILYVPTAHPRYLYRFQSAPVGSQWSEYFAWQSRFFAALNADIRRDLLYCALPYDFGHSLEERLISQFPEISFDSELSAPKRFPDSRFVVIDHCGTTPLESLAANAPTILYWHPQRWELRPEADKLFAKLRECRILFDSPESAAAHLSSVYAKPTAWWQDAYLQSVRREFVAQYALTSPTWPKDWTRLMLSELDSVAARSSEAGHAAF